MFEVRRLFDENDKILDDYKIIKFLGQGGYG